MVKSEEIPEYYTYSWLTDNRKRSRFSYQLLSQRKLKQQVITSSCQEALTWPLLGKFLLNSSSITCISSASVDLKKKKIQTN